MKENTNLNLSYDSTPQAINQYTQRPHIAARETDHPAK
jgi:hypothetical protein